MSDSGSQDAFVFREDDGYLLNLKAKQIKPLRINTAGSRDESTYFTAGADTK